MRKGEGNLLAAIFLSTFTIMLLYKRPRLERYPSLRTPMPGPIELGRRRRRVMFEYVDFLHFDFRGFEALLLTTKSTLQQRL